MNEPLSFQRLHDRLRDGRQATHRLVLDFQALKVAVNTNSPRLLEQLRAYFGQFCVEDGPVDQEITALETPAPDLADLDLIPKEPEPGKTKIKEEYREVEGGRIVRKRLTGMVFLFDQDRHLAVGPCEANDNQVINFVNSRHIQWFLDRGALLYHAAAVTHGGRGLALCGFAGAGKSTLALQLMSLGADFVSNDRLMVRREPDGGLMMYGVAKLPRINPGTALNNPDLRPILSDEEIEEFGSLPTSELWSLEHKYDAFLDELYGQGRFNPAAPMHGLVIIRWTLDGGPLEIRTVDLAQARELTPAFIKSPGLFFLDPEGAYRAEENDYLRDLGDCPVHLITGGVDFPGAARALGRLLGLEEA